jgi:hypothetical protein
MRAGTDHNPVMSRYMRQFFGFPGVSESLQVTDVLQGYLNHTKGATDWRPPVTELPGGLGCPARFRYGQPVPCSRSEGTYGV